MSYTRKNPNAELRSYYPVIFEGGIILVLLILLFLTNINIGKGLEETGSIGDHELVHLETIIPSLQRGIPEPPPRPIVPAEVPITVIIEDQIEDALLAGDMGKVDKLDPLVPERPITSAGSPTDIIVAAPIADLYLAASYKYINPTDEALDRPILPARVPLDIIIEDPITDFWVTTRSGDELRLAPPHPRIPAKVPVDIIIIDPVTDLKMQMDSRMKPAAISLILRNGYASSW